MYNVYDGRMRGIVLIALAPLVATAEAPERIGHYTVVLAETPAAVHGNLAAARRASKGIRSAQSALRRELRARNIEITGSDDLLVNAVFVRATRAEAEALRGFPGVKLVLPSPVLRPLMDRAATLVRAPAAWDAIGKDNAGLGVRIAIIDSGIDQGHPAFQDTLPPPENPPDSPAENAPYTSSKIIVARSYVSLLGPPDDDLGPRDHLGHGTGMAMVAAGVTNTGPAGTITGIAPKAYLGNYKIFGSAGLHDSTTVAAVVAAMSDAVKDNMDVILLGVGTQPQYAPLAQDPACAGPDPGFGIASDSCDVLAQAVESATRLGKTVIVPAGNDANLSTYWYPTLATVNTPGTAPSAITVGASRNSFFSLRVSGDGLPGALQHVDALFGDGPRPGDGMNATVRDVSAIDSTGLACSPLRAGSLTGAFALIERGDCAFADKTFNAQRAGAVGVILYQAEDDFLINPVGVSDTSIPTLMIGNTPGLALKNYLQQAPDTRVTVDTAIAAPGGALEPVADYSSRGPGIGSLPGRTAAVLPTIKPELVAVGDEIYTATQSLDDTSDIWDPSGYTFLHGTSFASAMAAGAAALVKQQNRGFTPAQVKSALVNTAVAEIATDDGSDDAAFTDMGAGKLNVEAALKTTVTAEPATLAFGVIRSGSLVVSLSLKLSNTGSAPAGYKLSVEQRTSDDNAKITVSPATLDVAAGEQATASVQLSGKPPAPGSYEGYIVIEGGAVPIKVPYLYIATDDKPEDILPIVNGEFSGKPGEKNWEIAFRLLDYWGVPVANVPVTFSVKSGGGSIQSADASTGTGGEAAALVTLGPDTGKQVFVASAGGMELEFYADVR